LKQQQIVDGLKASGDPYKKFTVDCW